MGELGQLRLSDGDRRSVLYALYRIERRLLTRNTTKQAATNSQSTMPGKKDSKVNPLSTHTPIVKQIRKSSS